MWAKQNFSHWLKTGCHLYAILVLMLNNLSELKILQFLLKLLKRLRAET